MVRDLRHSFGTSLAAKGVDVRTIQALMRHKRMNTTEQYDLVVALRLPSSNGNPPSSAFLSRAPSGTDGIF